MDDIDRLPPPSRELFENYSYKRYYSGKFGYKTTAIMTPRGCPFACDFSVDRSLVTNSGQDQHQR